MKDCVIYKLKLLIFSNVKIKFFKRNYKWIWQCLVLVILKMVYVDVKQILSNNVNLVFILFDL